MKVLNIGNNARVKSLDALKQLIDPDTLDTGTVCFENGTEVTVQMLLLASQVVTIEGVSVYRAGEDAPDAGALHVDYDVEEYMDRPIPSYMLTDGSLPQDDKE